MKIFLTMGRLLMSLQGSEKLCCNADPYTIFSWILTNADYLGRTSKLG